MPERERHLWVRFGGPAFCGKPGCGVPMTDATQQMKCDGEETPGIELLRRISGKHKQNHAGLFDPRVQR